MGWRLIWDRKGMMGVATIRSLAKYKHRIHSNDFLFMTTFPKVIFINMKLSGNGAERIMKSNI
jgi:hypothetical protein